MNKITNPKQTLTIARWLALGILVLGLTGATCTEERGVDIVVTTELIAQFQADGSINVIHDEQTVDVTDEIDLQSILDDNGYDEVKSGKIESAFYRVIEKDPVDGRTISGDVTVRKDPGTDQTLISYTNVAVNDPALEDWTPVPLEAAGVAVMNQAINSVIADLPTSLTFTADGTSNPQGSPTNFVWEVKLRVNFIVTKTVEVIDPI
jgi:hypothetical protein